MLLASLWILALRAVKAKLSLVKPKVRLSTVAVAGALDWLVSRLQCGHSMYTAPPIVWHGLPKSSVSAGGACCCCASPGVLPDIAVDLAYVVVACSLFFLILMRLLIFIDEMDEVDDDDEEEEEEEEEDDDEDEEDEEEELDS